MNFIKKYWYLILIALFTVGLGVVVYLTSQQLATTQQGGPTAPGGQPEAAASVCKLSFAINLTTTNTPTPTPTDTPTDTPTPTPEATSTPTPTPTPVQNIVYVNPTPTPSAACNSSCTINTDCGDVLVCMSSVCRNASCADSTSCSCGALAQAPQPTPKTPVSGGPTILGVSIIGIGALILILGLAL